MDFNMELKDEVVLVSGASRGIGKGIALALGARGATVIGSVAVVFSPIALFQLFVQISIAAERPRGAVGAAAAIHFAIRWVKRPWRCGATAGRSPNPKRRR